MSPRKLTWGSPDGGWPVFDETGKRVRPETEATYGECVVSTCHRMATIAVIGEAGDLYLCDLHGTKA